MREKLIELLCKAHNAVTDKSLENDSEFGMTYAEQIETEADSLIANGVTIQKWIPVTERLPDYFSVFIIAVRMPYRKGMFVDSADFDPFAKTWFPSMCWGKGYEVTHWMPLPETPNGERRTDDRKTG